MPKNYKKWSFSRSICYYRPVVMVIEISLPEELLVCCWSKILSLELPAKVKLGCLGEGYSWLYHFQELAQRWTYLACPPSRLAHRADQHVHISSLHPFDMNLQCQNQPTLLLCLCSKVSMPRKKIVEEVWVGHLVGKSKYSSCRRQSLISTPQSHKHQILLRTDFPLYIRGT